MNKKAVSFLGVKLVILAAFLTIGFIKLAEDTSINQETKAELLSQFPEKKVSAAIYTKSLDDLSPTIGFGEKKIFGVTEFPLFGTVHTIIILILIFISGFFIDRASIGFGWKILLYALLIPIGYYIGSWVLFFAFYQSASQFGLSFAEATELRRIYASSFDNILLPLIVVSIFGLISIAKAFGKRRK